MSNVLLAESATAAQTWRAPEVAGPLANRRRDFRTVGELEALERVAWDEAYAAGEQAGIAAGRAQYEVVNAALTEQLARFEALADLLARPLQRMDEHVERQLVELSLTIARQLLRRELRADPAQVIAIVRETVRLLPAAARDVRVQLHPEDAALLRERLSPTGPERAWTLCEDPMLSRGDCRVTAQAAEIDARVDTRLKAAISSLLGDERGGERTSGEDAAP